MIFHTVALYLLFIEHVDKLFKKVPQNEVQTNYLFDVFRGLGPKVPQGGPKDLPRALKVSPKVPKGAPGWFQGPPQGAKSEPKGPQRCPRVVPRIPPGREK